MRALESNCTEHNTSVLRGCCLSSVKGTRGSWYCLPTALTISYTDRKEYNYIQDVWLRPSTLSSLLLCLPVTMDINSSGIMDLS